MCVFTYMCEIYVFSMFSMIKYYNIVKYYDIKYITMDSLEMQTLKNYTGCL